MNQARVNSGQRWRAFTRLPFKTSSAFLLVWVSWIVVWIVLFSALDFWSIKLYHVCHARWFQEYRAAMRYGASWLSPPSFALAENAYFVWLNLYDPQHQMHEWEWFSGNPVNPDGHFNFVWGDGHGGWVKFPMKAWYEGWAFQTATWLVGITFLRAKWRRSRRRVTSPRWTSVLTCNRAVLQESED